jgi:hypothetical protein
MQLIYAAVALSLLGLHSGFHVPVPLTRLALAHRLPSHADQRTLRPLRPLRAAVDTDVEFFEAPEEAVRAAEVAADDLDEVDYVVIGSGIGGLSAAAMLKWYGYSVVVLESHYLPGGVAHTFERGGYKFDAGPSLWNGMSTKPYNPLREVLELVGQGDSIKYAKYDGWVMHIPEGSFKFQVGKGNFEPVIEKFGGQQALDEWEVLREVLKPIQELSCAIPPLILRSDSGVALTMLPHMLKLLKGGPIANKVQGSFYDVTKSVVKSEFLVRHTLHSLHTRTTPPASTPTTPPRPLPAILYTLTSTLHPPPPTPYPLPPQTNWFEFLSFALSGLPADGTIAAAVA